MQRKRKTTLLLDDAVWRQFQEEVMRSTGPRSLSAEVEKLLAAGDPEGFVHALEAVYPPVGEGFPSLQEVERMRPKTRRSTAALIREERDERDDRILGLERHREEVPRRRGLSRRR